MYTRNSIITDVEDIVEIHQNAFKNFFLTSLGKSFLNFYYSSFIKNKETVCIVEIENDSIIGFSAACTKSKGFNTRLILSNISNFTLWTFKMFFSNPKALIRLVKNLTKKRNDEVDKEEYGELFSIAIKSNQQNKGIGKDLLKATEEQLKQKGVKQLSLTTDFYNNESTLAFYKSMGYGILYEFIAYPNRRMYRMIKKL